MERENTIQVLQKYRRDRSVLLKFILSGNLLKKTVMPPGAVSLDYVDLDRVSVDYVLNCVRNGETLELAQAMKDCHDISESQYMSILQVPGINQPHIVPSLSVSQSLERPLANSKLVALQTESNSDSAVGRTSSEPLSSNKVIVLTVDDIVDSEDDDDLDEADTEISRRATNNTFELSLGLPPFATGITDDDLRESAYEVLLACAGVSGALVVPSKEKKKLGKKARLLKKLTGSIHGSTSKAHHATGSIGLLEIMRTQMEVSAAMDIRTRQGLINALVGKAGKSMDTFLLPLELLCSISPTEFSDKRAFIRWQKRQLNMLDEGLLNHHIVCCEDMDEKASEIRTLLSKIEESELLQASEGEIQRSKCLKSLRDVAIPLAERLVPGELGGEVCHWADGYYLNVGLYEKLLLSVFDVLEEGKLIREEKDIIELLKSTWRMLGVTETIHNACYTWVLFRQFVITRERGLLKHATEHLKRISLKGKHGSHDFSHLENLQSKAESEARTQNLSYLQTFILPIQNWADKQLQDYHLHFSEDSEMMRCMVTLAMVTRRLLSEELDTKPVVSDEDQIELYITTSLMNAFSRILSSIDTMSKTGQEHPLTLLAEDTKKLLHKDATYYVPNLSRWHPQATFVSVSLLHKVYGTKLNPFLDGAEHLTEDVISVFPAANGLEQYVISHLTSAYGEDSVKVYCDKLARYEVATYSRTLVMDWVNDQLSRVMHWVERAIQQESWNPISSHQRHGSSIVEVYRIVEETTDQFFALKVPMTTDQLNSLVCGLDNIFQVYANHVVDALASKEELIPPLPTLTRLRKENGLRAFVKKELLEHKSETEEIKPRDISVVETSALCIRLNTLHYGIDHLSKLEDSISDQWMENYTSEDVSQQCKFDGGRKDLNAAIDRVYAYIGTKIVFCDLHEQFVNNLYRPSVSQSRLETLLIEPLDAELNNLCGVIINTLRDNVAACILQACMDGLERVLLDGGPQRFFAPSDAQLLEEDLEILKDFFISGGDGLSPGAVEDLVGRVQEILKKMGRETGELIEELKIAAAASGVGEGGDRSKLNDNGQMLLKVLCHRSDREASLFVKKQYKIGV